MGKGKKGKKQDDEWYVIGIFFVIDLILFILKGVGIKSI